MRRVVLTIGLLLSVTGFGRLAAQSFVLDQNRTANGNRTASTPGGIAIGPSTPQNRLMEVETESEATGGGVPNTPNFGGGLPNFGGGLPNFGGGLPNFGGGLPNFGGGLPNFGGGLPNFGGGGGRPRMSMDDIRRMRAEEARRKGWELERQHQMIVFQQRVREEIETLLRGVNRDLFGETESIPVNLRKENAVAPNNGVLDRRVAETRSQPQPAPTPDDRLKTGDESFEADIRRQKAEIEQIKDAEERERQEVLVKQREEARRRFQERRAMAEKGADLFVEATELQIPEQRLRTGWCRLFDGKTFFGWRTQKEGPYGGGRFYIENQMICSDPKHPGLLYSTNQFGDATFQFEYQAEEDSEVFLLVRTAPNPRDLHSSCYAVVLNSADFQRPRGTILGRQTLSVEQLRKQERDVATTTTADDIPSGQRWRNFTAQFDGTMLRVMIDREEPITIYEAKPPGCGYLGILVTKGVAKFRNMTWFPGSSIPLFDGIDPTPEWRAWEGTQWAATKEVTLRLAGGPGAVETKKTFDNFVLQLEYNVTFPSGRSGLFVRSTPREERTGYEVSIQNFPTREDRQSTVGVDVGAFRNVKNGRYLRPDDQRWNYLTVLVVDRHFQTWVNGVPVCEWTVPAGQPLTASGTLRLLAPTERTDLQFRNIRVTPILPRTERPRTFEDRVRMTDEELSGQRNAADREKRLDEAMRKEGQNVP